MEKVFDKSYQSAEFRVEFEVSVVVAMMTSQMRDRSLTDFQSQPGRPQGVVSCPEWVRLQVKIFVFVVLVRNVIRRLGSIIFVASRGEIS